MGIQERKSREKIARKNSILDAAEKIFFERGYELANMDDIAEEVEISKGTIYLYFTCKEDVYFAICRRGMNLLALYMKESINENVRAIDNIINAGKAYIKFALEHDNYFVMMKDMMIRNPEKSPEADELYKEEKTIMDFFTQILKQGIEDGSVSPVVEPHILSFLLWSQTTGVLQNISHKIKYYFDNKVKIDDIVEANIQLLINGIKN